MLLLILIIGYYIINTWYKKRYENSLFKTQNEFYNIINYIHKSKARNLVDNQIKTNLKRSGWSSDQINYALKKYYGR
ncbi:MAG: hypothetical protein AABY22_36785 [Nanoarchaeota archaeon]